jgi:heme exporter protein A
VLQAEDLSIWRGERCLFQQLSFQLAPGEQLVLRGDNGAGKTTLLRILAGLTRPESGVLRWHGVALSAGLRAQCCYAGHTPALHPDLTVQQNLAFWAKLAGAPPAWDSALERLGITAQRDIEVRRLSAGQRRRAGLARLLFARSPVWLLDEPLSNLDSTGRATIEAALSAHRAAGGIAVIASHEAVAAGTSILQLGTAPERAA